jgi:putative transcription factor
LTRVFGFDNYKDDLNNKNSSRCSLLRCEVCGCRISGKPFNVIIEAARLTVCSECAKHGKICYDEPRPKPVFVKSKPTVVMPRVQAKTKLPPVDASVELSEDFGSKIRKGRERLGFSHEELGKRINEKVSLLRKIETSKIAPNDRLAATLEHVLKIKLIVPAKEEKVPQAKIPQKPSRELTLGDLMQQKRKDEKAGESTGRKQS